MSFIGSLEQLDFVNVVRRIEVFSKTGLLIVKQEALWIEFYFREGQLVCVGPLRAHTNLIERLVQANVLSSQTIPHVQALVGDAEPNETQLALLLMNEGYLSRDDLRAWTSQETAQILQAVISWPDGNVYFEDDYPAPTERLLVALSASILLDLPQTPVDPLPQWASSSAPTVNEVISLPTSDAAPIQSLSSVPPGHFIEVGPAGQLQTAQPGEPVSPFVESAPAPVSIVQQSEQMPTLVPVPDEGAGLFSAAQLLDELPSSASDELSAAFLVDDASPLSFLSETPEVNFGAELESAASEQISFLPPQPIAHPLPPARINTAFMTPDLVLMPVDLSSLREHNPQVQLTPDQWRLFALMNGQVSLQELCQMLVMSAKQVCALAGELIAIGLVMPPTNSMPLPLPLSALARVNNERGMASSAPSGGTFPARAQQPVPPFPLMPTQSQWGNGQSGANFTIGNGWAVPPQQPEPQRGQGQRNPAYAHVGGYR